MAGPLRFSALHAWAREEDDGTVSVGITDHAQYELGELQYLGLPRTGSLVTRDAAFGEVESAKTACELYAPCSGTVVAVNLELAGDPATVNRDPYGTGWMIRIMPSDRQELRLLLDEAAHGE